LKIFLKNELTKLVSVGHSKQREFRIYRGFFAAPPPQKNFKTTLINWLPIAIYVKLSSYVKVLVISYVLLTRVKLSLHKAKNAHTGSGGKVALVLKP